MRLIYTIALSLATQALYAQQDTSYALPEVQVNALHEVNGHTAAGNHIADSVSLAMLPSGSIAAWPILMQNGFRQYGPGRLTTVALRGSGTQQTAIFWEDVPINSPMLGVADLGLIMLDPNANIKIQQGARAQGQGMGASSGAIFLRENYPAQQSNAADLALQAGSFGQRNARAAIQLGNRQISSRITGQWTTAKNNYPHDYFGNTRKLPNAALDNRQLKWTGKVQASLRHSLTLGTWLLDYMREIPPSRLQAGSEAVESGDAWRSFARHEWTGKKVGIQTTLAYTSEAFSYEDPQLSLNQTNRSNMLFARQKWYGGTTRMHWTAGWDGMYVRANSPNYPQGPQIKRGAVWGKTGGQDGANSWQALFRQDFSDQRMGVPVVTGMMGRKVVPGLKVWANGGSLFRWPAMDDLFWVPGGNDQLKPESGYSVESGANWDMVENQSLAIKSAVTGFYRMQYNAIRWLPDGGLWSAQNVGRWRSMGAVFHVKSSYNPGNWRWTGDLQWQYTHSDQMDPNDGIQEIYIPEHTLSLDVMGRWKWLSFRTLHSFRSHRYFLNAENARLPAVLLSDVVIDVAVPLFDMDAHIQLTLQNVLDVRHEWVVNRPMPGRSFNLQIILNNIKL
jgi:vitamin B12 transporter